jgi:gamma-glutamylcyclotransferase
MDARQMRARCPSAEPLETAVLRGFRLVFSGHSVHWGGAVATLVRDPRATVCGRIYRVSLCDLRRLDRFEGTPFVYRRVRVSLRDAHGRRRRAQAYLLSGRPRRAPAPNYLLTILGAYNALGFDTAPLLRAAFSEGT